MDTTQAFYLSMAQGKALGDKIKASIPYKGMNNYRDKSTMVMEKFIDPKAFEYAKQSTARKGQSSCLCNVLDAGGRLQ